MSKEVMVQASEDSDMNKRVETMASGLSGSLRKYVTPEKLAGEEAALKNALANASVKKYERANWQ